MDQDFFNPIFDEAREKTKKMFNMMSTPIISHQQSLYSCHKCGSQDILSLSKQVRSCDEGTSVFNRCNKCQNKWRDG